MILQVDPTTLGQSLHLLLGLLLVLVLGSLLVLGIWVGMQAGGSKDLPGPDRRGVVPNLL